MNIFKYIGYAVIIYILGISALVVHAADVKVSELPEKTTDYATDDIIVITDISEGTTNKIEMQNYQNILDCNAYGGLTSAISTLGTTTKTLIVNDDQAISDNLTIPANISLIVTRNGRLTVAATKTLTINGTIIAGAYQIYYGTGTVTFSGTGIYYGKWSSGGSDTASIDGNVITNTFAVVAGAANLGTGSVDGEMKICADEHGNRYTWDNDNTKWRVMDGNLFATVDLPGTSYTIATGTWAHDTTLDLRKKWNGASWVLATAHTLTAKTSDFTITSAELTGDITLTNYGAAGTVQFQLPAGSNNDICHFYIAENQEFFVYAATDENLRYGSDTTNGSGYVHNDAVGVAFTVMWGGGTEWVITGLEGSLTYDE